MRASGSVALALAFCLGCAHAPAPASSSPRKAQRAAAELTEDYLVERLGAYGKLLKAQGFTQTPFLTRGFLPPSARDTHPVRITAGHCALLVALASPTVDDLDAALYTPGGEVVMEDDGSDARPVLSLCAGSEPLELYYSVHAYQGAGAFVARIFERRRAGDEQPTVLAEGGPSLLHKQTLLLRKKGFEDDAPPVDVALRDASPVRMALRVSAGECYTLVAEAGEGLDELSVRLLDGGGRELAFGVGDDGLAALQYCAHESADYGVQLLADAGQGTVRIARFHAPESVVGGKRALWLGEPSPSSQAVGGAKTLEEWRDKARADRAQLGRVEQLELAQGQVRELPLGRPAARCERWYATTSSGLIQAAVRVEALDGTALAQAEVGSEGGTLSMCGRSAPARLVLTGLTGFGSITVAAATLAQPVSSK